MISLQIGRDPDVNCVASGQVPAKLVRCELYSPSRLVGKGDGAFVVGARARQLEVETLGLALGGCERVSSLRRSETATSMNKGPAAMPQAIIARVPGASIMAEARMASGDGAGMVPLFGWCRWVGPVPSGLSAAGRRRPGGSPTLRRRPGGRIRHE